MESCRSADLSSCLAAPSSAFRTLTSTQSAGLFQLPLRVLELILWPVGFLANLSSPASRCARLEVLFLVQLALSCYSLDEMSVFSQ